jgi:hypothetical protein
MKSTRRSFLKGLAATTTLAAAPMAGLAAQPRPTPRPVTATDHHYALISEMRKVWIEASSGCEVPEVIYMHPDLVDAYEDILKPDESFATRWNGVPRITFKGTPVVPNRVVGPGGIHAFRPMKGITFKCSEFGCLGRCRCNER